MKKWLEPEGGDLAGRVESSIDFINEWTLEDDSHQNAMFKAISCA